MRPSGTHLYKRVCPFVRRSVGPSVRPSVRPSVGRSVGPLRLCKNRVSRLFLATVRSYTETNDQPTCFESLLYYSVVSPVCSSICLSVYVTWSIHAETQSGRIFARSGLFLVHFVFYTWRLEAGRDSLSDVAVKIKKMVIFILFICIKHNQSQLESLKQRQERERRKR